MSTTTPAEADRRIVYPEDNGEPLAENTIQYRWIVTIHGNLAALFADRPDVFLAADLLWYPVEGRPEISAAPDTMVVFGRPKGERRSYKQWEEDGLGPQVVFEVLSPSNRFGPMLKKFQFYDEFEVEEYYLYDPETIELTAYRREGEHLVEIPQPNGWISPRLGIRFDLAEELTILGPAGHPFATFQELHEEGSRRAPGPRGHFAGR